MNNNNKSDIVQGIALAYFVLCFALTAIATERKIFTYGQISVLYLPLLIGFCVWQTKRYFSRDSENRPSRVRTVLSVGLCAVMSILTVIYNVAGLFE